jgi:hypothetical protein
LRKKGKLKMENDQPTSYEVPADIESLSPDEAAGTLRKIYADAVGNPQHPHNVKTHFQHTDFVTAVTRLHEIKCPEPEPQTNEQGQELIASQQFSQPVIDAMAEGLEIQAGENEAVQQKLREGLRQEIEQVNELIPGSDIDIYEACENATPEMLEGYKMMRLLGQGDFASLTPLLLKDATKLGMPLKQVEQLRFFLSDAVPGDPLSEDIANIIIRHIHKAKKLRANRGD